jgi:RimJ/RimL family protein N-acetyltransferase
VGIARASVARFMLDRALSADCVRESPGNQQLSQARRHPLSPRLRDDVMIRPWAAGDLPLLERLLGDPVMMSHLGGPDSPEAIRARHERYLATPVSAGGVFAIVVGRQRTAVGWVGFWESSWHGEEIWECGWSVLPEFQRTGLAAAATAFMLEHARMRVRHRFVHAFPSVANAASDALCRRLGFESLGEVEVEYPKGVMMRSNDWRMDLLGGAPSDSRDLDAAR